MLYCSSVSFTAIVETEMNHTVSAEAAVAEFTGSDSEPADEVVM